MSFFSQFPKTTYDFMQNGVDTTIVDLFRFIKVDDRLLDDLSIYQYYQIRAGERPDVVSAQLYGTDEYYWVFFMINEQLKSGLTAWPMDSETFEKYIEKEYDGTVIETYPRVEKDGDGRVVGHPNSLADRFVIGETVEGVLSGATGTVFSKDTQLSQLVLVDVEGTFRVNETVRSVRTTGTQDEVDSYRVWAWRDAPHHFEDANGLITYNALHIDEQEGGGGIQPGTADSELTPISNYQNELELNDERSNIRVVRPDAIFEFAKSFSGLLNT